MLNFAEIKSRFSFSQVIHLLELDLKKNGNEWRGPCPTCRGSTDRTLVVTEGVGFKCFTSKAGGSQLDLVSHIQGVSLKEAAEWLDSQGPERPPQRQQLEGKFDRAKYQAGLNRNHELLKDIPEELVTRLDLGVPDRGSLKGLVNIPLYDQSGAFVAYCGVPSIQLPKTIK
jgi:hypothetical protein